MKTAQQWAEEAYEASRTKPLWSCVEYVLIQAMEQVAEDMRKRAADVFSENFNNFVGAKHQHTTMLVGIGDEIRALPLAKGSE